MAHDDYDPVLFGKVLERLDQQDKVLSKLSENMEVLMASMNTRKGIEKAVWALIGLAGFMAGHFTQWFSFFRGPPHQ